MPKSRHDLSSFLLNVPESHIESASFYRSVIPCIEISDMSSIPMTLKKFEYINTQESGIFSGLFEMT